MLLLAGGLGHRRGTAECEDALRAFTDTMLEEMKEGFWVSGRVREGMEWGREGEREGM